MSTATLERPPSTTGASAPGNVTAPAPVTVTGILDRQDQHGFLRTNGYLPGPADLYIPPAMIRRYGLRPGDLITGTAAEPSGSENRRPVGGPPSRTRRARPGSWTGSTPSTACP